MEILVLGGAGFIGSHTVVELLNDGYDVVIFDNLSNSNEEVINRIEKITSKRPVFIKGDVLDKNKLNDTFKKYKFDCVIDFAGLKAVGESVKKPVEYYKTNIISTLNIVECMKENNVFNIIFSSSATVYGNPVSVPVDETSEVKSASSPYGSTKIFNEIIFKDLYNSDPRFNIALLRYFNPIGAHPSGLIGEDPNGIPNNLVPYITQVMVGKREKLTVFGNDYKTPDGTCIRDYIHVCDLARGHVLAIKKLMKKPGLVIYNLGTGIGLSVLDIVNAFKKVYGKEIPFVFGPRRDGDIPENYTKVDKAFNELGFKTIFKIEDMAKDSWNWQKNNPNGYKK